ATHTGIVTETNISSMVPDWEFCAMKTITATSSRIPTTSFGVTTERDSDSVGEVLITVLLSLGGGRAGGSADDARLQLLEIGVGDRTCLVQGGNSLELVGRATSGGALDVGP